MSADSSTVVSLADTVSRILYGIAGWLLVGVGVLGIALTILRTSSAAPERLALSAMALLFSALFIVFGVFVNPRFRQRINRHHSPARFGRVRSVDSRVLRTEEGRSENCANCGAGLSEGLVRRYREEYCVAGVPVATVSEGRNYYCVDCATTVEADGTPSDSAVVTERSESTPTDSFATDEN
jgi:hypothetical protein